MQWVGEAVGNKGTEGVVSRISAQDKEKLILAGQKSHLREEVKIGLGQ